MAKSKLEIALEIISLQNDVIHGNKNKFGLLDCYDNYYKGCWDDDFKKINKLKTKL